MTDLLNIAKECGAIFEGPCQACGGSGVIMETITVPVCCGRCSPHGDCCGNPDPAQEYQPAQCGCGGITFMHLSTDQLHATVEKVCGPLVEALEESQMPVKGIIDMYIRYKDSISVEYWNSVLNKNDKLIAEYRKLMGQDK